MCVLLFGFSPRAPFSQVLFKIKQLTINAINDEIKYDIFIQFDYHTYMSVIYVVEDCLYSQYLATW